MLTPLSFAQKISKYLEHENTNLHHQKHKPKTLPHQLKRSF